VITRRAALGLALVPAIALAEGPPVARFRIFREGREVGTHVVTREPGGVTQSRLDIHVRLAGFSVFRQRVESRETLERGLLAGFVQRAERNGRASEVSVRPAGAGLRAEGPEGGFDLPRGALPLAWWWPARFEAAQLFDPASGRPIAARPRRVARAGGGYAVTLPGQEPPAEAIYDAAGVWIGFVTRGSDGSAVTYERG
jgi:hypothetical protein